MTLNTTRMCYFSDVHAYEIQCVSSQQS